MPAGCWVYIKIQIGMYGLKQAGKLTNESLTKHLVMWPLEHVWWCLLTFLSVIDYFGIKFTGASHAAHLMQTLQYWYEVSVNWSGTFSVV